MSLEIVDELAAEITALQIERPVIVLELPLLDAWMLIGELQLALRHPENTGPSRAAAERVKSKLMALVCTTPTLAKVALMGDDPRFDR